MTLIEILFTCMGKNMSERKALMAEMGVEPLVQDSVQQSFTNDGRLIGGLDDGYTIVKGK